jgi:undecaprenyl diphosphate synthase
MRLTKEYLSSYQQKLIDEGIRVAVIGNVDVLPRAVKAVLQETIDKTAHCDSFTLVLAINYGGRDEIVRACAKIVAEHTDPNNISEKTISEHLDTRFWPDPDLVIRTSGENRLSNFLLWQTSYAEVYIENATWPDFSEKHLTKAVRDYQMRERRLGGRI